jgi:hypothetical protein
VPAANFFQDVQGLRVQLYPNRRVAALPVCWKRLTAQSVAAVVQMAAGCPFCAAKIQRRNGRYSNFRRLSSDMEFDGVTGSPELTPSKPVY